MSDRKPNQFQPGHPGGPGRPKNSRNRLSTKFLDALAKDFEEHGEGVLKIVRAEDPSGYLRVVASLMPKELDIEAHVRRDEFSAWLGWLHAEPAVVQSISARQIEVKETPQIAEPITGEPVKVPRRR